MDNEIYNRYILNVKECGNLTKAAAKLGISQPALSAGISKLEQKLGFKIFIRKSNPLKITQEGAAYIEYLKKQQLLINEYKQKVADISESRNRRVVIGGPAVYVETLITKAVYDFRQVHPDCEILIKNESIFELVEMAERGEVDCFISTIGNLPNGFLTKEIKQEKIFLGVPKAWSINRDLQENPGNYRALEHAELISMESNQPLQTGIRQFLKEYQLPASHHITVNQVSTGIALAAMGAGAVFASEDALKNSKYSQQLEIYPLPEAIFKRSIYIAFYEERYISQVCREFITLLQKEG